MYNWPYPGPVELRSRMPEVGTTGSVRGWDGQPPGLLDLRFTEKASAATCRLLQSLTLDVAPLPLTPALQSAPAHSAPQARSPDRTQTWRDTHRYSRTGCPGSTCCAADRSGGSGTAAVPCQP